MKCEYTRCTAEAEFTITVGLLVGEHRNTHAQTSVCGNHAPEAGAKALALMTQARDGKGPGAAISRHIERSRRGDPRLN